MTSQQLFLSFLFFFFSFPIHSTKHIGPVINNFIRISFLYNVWRKTGPKKIKKLSTFVKRDPQIVLKPGNRQKDTVSNDQKMIGRAHLICLVQWHWHITTIFHLHLWSYVFQTFWKPREKERIEETNKLNHFTTHSTTASPCRHFAT